MRMEIDGAEIFFDVSGPSLAETSDGLTPPWKLTTSEPEVAGFTGSYDWVVAPAGSDVEEPGAFQAAVRAFLGRLAAIAA